MPRCDTMAQPTGKRGLTMGFIKAAAGAISGTLADQWIDFLLPPDNVPATAVMFPAVPKGQNAGRGSNVRSSENVITTGSKIVVPEGYGLLTFQNGRITNFVAEAGGFIFSDDDRSEERRVGK